MTENADYIYLGRKNIDLFLNVNFEESAFGGIVLKTKLYDVNSKNLVLSKTFTTSNMNQSCVFSTQSSSIAINSYMNAPSIAWMDKFVVYSVYKKAKQSDIIISDYTLSYQKNNYYRWVLIFFLNGLVIKQDAFYFTRYVNSIPTLYKINIYTKRMVKILDSDGMIVASDVSSDGNKLLITASPEGQPDVYMLDLRTKRQTKITSYKGIDVGAHFINNDKKIVFVSDRLNRPNIFSKTIGRRGVERLVYHGSNNSSVTTFNDKVVYTSRDRNSQFDKRSFNLFLISTRSDYIKKLTVTGVNQFPKFSSDGESILFIKNFNNKSSVGIVRLNFDKVHLFSSDNGANSVN